ncbi:MAG TPA: site-specific DNA-methyltransferase [Anaerolineae bacterium]|nr:site-specific DNA-methyltransferase [Anaerolineae bacterium]
MIHPTNQSNLLINAHVLDALDILAANSVQTVVTSPPYWGMRRYRKGMKCQWPDKVNVPFGAEPTPELYVHRTREVLCRLKNCLRSDGIIWWNLGDTYFTRAILRESSSERLAAFEGRRKDKWVSAPLKRYSSGHQYLKDKDLTLMPFLIAHSAQQIGLWLRSVIIWEKENHLPEPRIDRPVSSHEYILMFTKSKHYKWNYARARERRMSDESEERQLRTIWKMSTAGGKVGHPAMFPEELVERCIQLSTRKKDVVLDPFVGSGTTALVAARLGRSYIGVDIVREYLQLASERLKRQQAAGSPAESYKVERHGGNLIIQNLQSSSSRKRTNSL